LTFASPCVSDWRLEKEFLRAFKDSCKEHTRARPRKAFLQGDPKEIEIPAENLADFDVDLEIISEEASLEPAATAKVCRVFAMVTSCPNPRIQGLHKLFYRRYSTCSSWLYSTLEHHCLWRFLACQTVHLAKFEE
jgi:hypothetical protein